MIFLRTILRMVFSLEMCMRKCISSVMNCEKRHKTIFRFYSIIILFILINITVTLNAQTVTWRSTTNTNRWVDKGFLSFATGISATSYVELYPDTLCQTIEGFGGCFSEKAWNAIKKLDALKQDTIIRALFDTSGCSFNFCRMPIGASDFADIYYSCNDSAGDYDMSAFNLCRDSLRIIPFIKASMVYQPNLKLWGSPWSPPQWMKTDGKYYGSGTLKQDSQTLNAYSLYLEKTVQSFQAQGINMTVLSAQNEPTQGNGQPYPSCVWSPEQLRNFYKNYLIPRFRNDSVNVKLMWGTFCAGSYTDWITNTMADTAILNSISVFGLQNTESAWAPMIYAACPGKKIYETETSCCHNNDWAGAVIEFNLLAKFLNGGAAQYSEWNMVLDQTGMSGWKWKQAAMITVDTIAKTFAYNPAFYGVQHWTHYIKQNAHRIKLVNSDSLCKGLTSAFLNPDGTIVLLAGNEAATTYALTIKLGNKTVSAVLPAASFNTFVIRPQPSFILSATTENKVVSPVSISNLYIHNTTLFFRVATVLKDVKLTVALSDLKGRIIGSGVSIVSDRCNDKVQTLAIKTRTGRIPSGVYLATIEITSERSSAMMSIGKKLSVIY